jgi:hypothetical protein
MATIQHSHRSTGRRRRIGPIGTTARLIVGGLLLGSVVQGHLAGPFRPAAWALGLLGFPALLLRWQWLRARRTPTRLQATGPVANVLNVVLFLALYLTPAYAPVLSVTSDAALSSTARRCCWPRCADTPVARCWPSPTGCLAVTTRSAACSSGPLTMSSAAEPALGCRRATTR